MAALEHERQMVTNLNMELEAVIGVFCSCALYFRV